MCKILQINSTWRLNGFNEYTRHINLSGARSRDNLLPLPGIDAEIYRLISALNLSTFISCIIFNEPLARLREPYGLKESVVFFPSWRRFVLKCILVHLLQQVCNNLSNSMAVGLGGLRVTCSPRDARFAGSNPTEVDGFFQDVKILRDFKQGVPSMRFQAR